MPDVTIFHLLIAQEERPHSPPLGPLMIAASAREAGYDVAFKQLWHRRGTPLRISDFRSQLLSADSPVVAVSCMIDALPILALALMTASEENPNTAFVAGGPGFGGIGHDVMAHVTALRAVALGEGESTFVQVLDSLLRGKGELHSIPGILSRSEPGGPVRSGGPLVLVDDLDALPPPAFDLIRFDDYGGVPVQATRGCPFRCTFCDVAPAWSRKHRRRSIAAVVNHLCELKEVHGVDQVGFVDDLLMVDINWFRRLCEALASADTPNWVCTGHVNILLRMAEKDLELLRRAGCVKLFAGIESGSDSILKKIRKSFRFSDALSVARKLQGHLEFQTNLLWGFPFETPHELNETLIAAKELEALGVDVGTPVLVSPLASSPLYAEHGSAIVFDPSAPNIFYSMLDDLEPSSRSAVDRLIESRPLSYCAFYYFKGESILKRARMVRSATGARLKPRRLVVT